MGAFPCLYSGACYLVMVLRSSNALQTILKPRACKRESFPSHCQTGPARPKIMKIMSQVKVRVRPGPAGSSRVQPGPAVLSVICGFSLSSSIRTGALVIQMLFIHAVAKQG